MTSRFRSCRALVDLAAAALLAGCAAAGPALPPALTELPAPDEFCLSAQRLVTHTSIAMKSVLHADFNEFVKSKALIEGPSIQQFNWADADGRLLAISCKLKSADHLVAAFGPDSAGPDGNCQDMNRAVHALVAREVPEPVFATVIFEAAETVGNKEQPGMTGPDWLAPFTLTSVDADGALRIRTKGFVVGFLDQRFAQMPVRFRGVHYCHFIAPEHLRDLLAGRARAGAIVGRTIVADPGAMTR